MRTILLPIAGCIFLILSVSCSNDGSGPIRMVKPLPEPGVIQEKIICASDSGISYALYIPGTPKQTPTPGSRRVTPPPALQQTPPPARPQEGRGAAEKPLYPIIIVFDPHGDGVLPLKMYKDIAEKYGFILVGSNDSKNGLPSDEVKGIVTTLMQEVLSVYPVDTNRIYLLGFSGGARVASMSAMYTVPVKGVIGCGAGFSSAEQPILYKFDFFGIAGTADFNINEMLQLDEPLSRYGFRHFIATFRGIHAWPPPAVMEDGFQWFILNAMKDGTLKKDDAFISGILTGFETRTRELKSSNQLIAAADACREAISFAAGLAPADYFQEELNSLEKLPDFQSQVAFRSAIQKQEEEEKRELMQALQLKDMNWWKNWISSHASTANFHKKINPEDTLKNRRLMAFLSLFCYMNANAAMSQRDENAAIKIIAIYEMADDVNPEPNYMRAVLLARRSEYEAAFSQLKIAVTKGFSDKKRLTGQPEFGAMNNSEKWLDLIKTIR